MKKINLILLLGSLFSGFAKADLRTLQNSSFVDLTVQESSVELNIVENTDGKLGAKCGVELRANQPFSSSTGLAKLQPNIKVELRLPGPVTKFQELSSQNGSTYTYTSQSAFGSEIRVSTLNGESLEHAIESAFGSGDEEAPRLIVTRIQCQK